MSRTFKDKPYRVLKREALEHGYTYLRYNWMHPTEPPTVEGDVAAYSYSRGRKEHIPFGYRWHNWHDYEDGWHPDYVNRRTVRDRCRIAVREANDGVMDDDWDDPRLYRRRVKWECWLKEVFSDRSVFVPTVAGCQGRVRPF